MKLWAVDDLEIRNMYFSSIYRSATDYNLTLGQNLVGSCMQDVNRYSNYWGKKSEGPISYFVYILYVSRDLIINVN